jgi:hypothetical protein
MKKMLARQYPTFKPANLSGFQNAAGSLFIPFVPPLQSHPVLLAGDRYSRRSRIFFLSVRRDLAN